MQYRNFKMAPRLMFGRGCYAQFADVLQQQRRNSDDYVVFLVDPSQRKLSLPNTANDLIIYVDTSEEPKTYYVDSLTAEVQSHASHDPVSVIGIGGGSAMDIAKAVALLLTNPGSSELYQGWDLIQHPAIHHVGIPTLSGTGAEASRTTVLTGPNKKLGMNSDHTVFDQIILDPELIKDVPKEQWFYTGMDCYIHNVEALNGTMINEFSRAFGEKSLSLCHQVFLDDHPDGDDKLMIASYFGGQSIAYSQVGACHALSYGLSYVLGYRHGVGNCIAFAALEDYYPQEVSDFRRMLDKHRIHLPTEIYREWSDVDLDRMVTVAMNLPPLWQNVYGNDWQQHVTPEKVRGLYARM